MHDQRVSIEWPPRLAVLPRLTAIQAAQRRTRLHRGKDASGHQRVRRNPADMTRIWSWWKAPRRCRRQLAQCGKLPPRVATVLRAKECRWLGTRVDHAAVTHGFHCTDGHGHHLLVRDALAGMLPGVARVIAAPQPLIEGAAIDLLRAQWVHRHAHWLAAHQAQISHPFPIALADHRQRLINRNIQLRHCPLLIDIPLTSGVVETTIRIISYECSLMLERLFRGYYNESCSQRRCIWPRRLTLLGHRRFQWWTGHTPGKRIYYCRRSACNRAGAAGRPRRPMVRTIALYSRYRVGRDGRSGGRGGTGIVLPGTGSRTNGDHCSDYRGPCCLPTGPL